MFNKNYNADVLTCLANLSNDEVFTHPNVANKMLDLLPQELWSDKTKTFLDPFTKSGVFLREITKRLLIGLEKEIPDLQDRLDHILTKQVYGIGISELTALLARRSLYCSKNANKEFSITDVFDNDDGNILYKNIGHKWKNLKCEYCGASKNLFNREDFLEQHAFDFIHTNNPKEFFKMKFDVVIGNPPYQLNDGSGASTDSAMPIYQKFISSAIKLNPRFISMIIPSRWMIGGRGLDKFRSDMLNNSNIKFIYDYENEKDCFPGMNISGGVCYFLIDKNYNGKCNYTFHSKKGSIESGKRDLKNKFSKFVIRDLNYNSLIEKCFTSNSFASIVSRRKPYGIDTFLFNSPERFPDSNLQMKKFDNSLRIFGVKGIKGGAKRVEGYIDKKIVKKNIKSAYKYKIFFPKGYSTGAINFPELILAKPGEICTETFLEIGPFKSEAEQLNCYNYMHTKFFKALLYLGKGSTQVTKDVFSLIPMIDFASKISDEDLSKQFNLSKKEINSINNLFV